MHYEMTSITSNVYSPDQYLQRNDEEVSHGSSRDRYGKWRKTYLCPRRLLLFLDRECSFLLSDDSCGPRHSFNRYLYLIN